MTQEDKELLLKDLCARLPYGVICYDEAQKENGFFKTFEYEGFGRIHNGRGLRFIENIKPYLFPLSSMTESQNDSWRDTWFPDLMISTDVNYPESEKYLVSSHVKSLQWLYENHFDINGLIDKGLALDATDKNIY